jgi:chorismate dehydratase
VRRILRKRLIVYRAVASFPYPRLEKRLRVAAINFLNPAPLMWDFEHPPLASKLAESYQIERMLPSECADRLASGRADIGLVPIAALAVNSSLRILPGCTIASKKRVRSLLLVHRARQRIDALRSIAADVASRTTVAYARILLHQWGNPDVPFIPANADLDAMLEREDAAILIGDPALLALEERANRFERTGEQLVYLDLAAEWIAITAVPFVSAVWCYAGEGSLDPGVVDDFNRSRIHGLENTDALVTEWSRRLPISEQTIQTYLTSNIHYALDQECIEGMRVFFRMASSMGILPEYSLRLG